MRIFVFAFALSAFVVPVLAQDAPAPPADCAAAFTTFGMFETSADTVIEDTANGCRATDIRVNLDYAAIYKIAELTIEAPDLLEALGSGTLPARAEINVIDIVVGPDIEDPLYDYILQMQATPFDARLSYTWDRDTGSLQIAELSLGDQETGYLSLAGRAEGVTPEAFELARSGAPVAAMVHELSLTIGNPWLFTGFLATPLVATLPSGEDPRPAIDNYRAAAIALLTGLPDTMVDGDSKAVLEQFVASFPRPMGEYVFQARSENGVTLLPEDPTRYLELLAPDSGLTIAASHTPAD